MKRLFVAVWLILATVFLGVGAAGAEPNENASCVGHGSSLFARWDDPATSEGGFRDDLTDVLKAEAEATGRKNFGEFNAHFARDHEGASFEECISQP